MIGIDAGTSQVKAVRFGPDGRAQQAASEPTAVRAPQPGWSEQDMDEVWAAVRRVVREVAPDDGLVDAVCTTAQGDGCWLVDEAGRPARPAVLWNDARAGAVVDAWERDGLLAEAFRVNGSYGNAGLASAQLAWLRAADDPGLARARTLLSCGSWVHLQLTGQRALHESDAGNPFLDARTGAVAQDVLDRLGVGWAVDLLPEVLDGTSAPAPLLPGAADELGLRAGTPVVLGPYDVPATALGLGAVVPGDGFAVLGTTLCVGSTADGPGLERDPSGMSLRIGYPDRWLLAYATLAGTEVLEWARQLLGLPGAADLVRLATDEAGAGRQEPPLVLPYLSPAGERAPFRDPLAAGAVLGLRLGHGPADLARGVLEGLSLAVRDCLLASGAAPASLAVCGGGARSAGWCAMLADATGLRVVAAEQDQVGALGAVRAGELATGRLRDLDQVAAAGGGTGRVHEPDPGRAERFTGLYERFVQARAEGAARA